MQVPPETPARVAFRLAPLLLFLGICPISTAGAGAAETGTDRADANAPREGFRRRLAEIDAIHPEVRRVASPTGGRSVSVNPPALLWPTSGGSRTRYAVRLSQDPKFSAAATISAAGLRWALFNPHRKLPLGVWYWQYGVVARPGEAPKWSETHTFTIEDSARTFVTPEPGVLIAGCPKSHPRVLIGPDGLAGLRKRLAGSPQADGIARSAARYVGKPLPEESRAAPKEKGTDPFEAKNFAKWASKGYAGDLAGSTSYLAAAYLITGDEKIGREAARRAVFVARLDPDGVTAPKVSDFADGSCMRAMALGYDCCYEFLTEEERRQLREAMDVRASRFFGKLMNNLEGRVFNAHVWQHILMDGTDVAVARMGELPEAETWMTYVYEVWNARVPLLGGDDGGWANGLNYFGTNFNTLLAMPSLFERLTGNDFFDQPWYRNTPGYLLYCWPPGSASDSFGDGAERDREPSASYARFAQSLGRRFDDPHALWYASQILGERGDDNPGPVEMLQRLPIERPGEPPAPKPPADLPAARLFQDVGIVSMHTDLADSSRDLMVGFRSSPYGSFNHMHSDQNSFSLLYGGERLFATSGYYIGYGDEHFKEWYTASRGQNTVLVDGRGQVRGAEGFGVVSRFLHGRRISYCLGDASRAYGDARLTTFRRHLALLRPSTIVVYDELEADHRAEWSWLLHSKQRITADDGRGRLEAAVDTARAQVDLFASTTMKLSVTDRFDPPAANWRGKKSGGEVIEYPDQWHATAMPVEKAEKMRILAVIQVRPDGKAGDGRIEASSVEAPGRRRVQIGRWQIEAELRPSQPTSLLISSDDGKTVLSAGDTETSLVEEDAAVDLRCADELPAAAR